MRRVRPSKISDLNQLLISIRHTAVARCAIFELDYGPLDYRIAIFDVLLVSVHLAIRIYFLARKPDGDWASREPAFQLLLIGRERA